jgi:UDP-glucose:(heptosyl)LPS alpha-1,3-glucosyltransferase
VSSLFVLPTYYEPFSNACLEAFAGGVPVITTTANGFAEILKPGVDGEIVAPGDLPALTNAMHQWLQRGERAELRDQLKTRAAEFSIERNVAETMEVLSLMAPKRA